MDKQCNEALFDIPPGVDRDRVERIMRETDADVMVEEYLRETRRWKRWRWLSWLLGWL